jgi:CRP-like cAMP-binding protein/predicted acylesterase/phospholipase RssA
MESNTQAQENFRPPNIVLLSFLKSNYLFERFSETILQTVIADMKWARLRKGETLFRQGDPGEFLFLVFHGRLQVTITKKDGSEVVVAEVGSGKPLGEIQFLSGGMRTANVYALEDTELLKLSKTAFDRLAEQNPEILHQMAEIIRQRLRRDQLVAMLPNLCGPLDTAMLQDIEDETEWIYLPQGKVLFHQGDPGDSFFLVISGRLHAVVQSRSGNERVVGEVRRGETVGEMAMFTGENRSATVYATRNSELVKFSKWAFERIIALHPNIMMRMTQTIIKRLQKTHSSSQIANPVMNVTVVAASPDVPLTDFSNRLVTALSAFGKTLHLHSKRLDNLLGIPGMAQTPEDAPNNIRLAAWLDEQETQYRVILYEADMFPSPWTKRCIQQADRILIVAQADADPTPGKIERALLGPGKSMTKAQRTLVLLHPDGDRLPSDSGRWLAVRQVETHHHLRWDTDTDFERLARFLSGKAIGLVLGGGGARGCAHVGVIRALQEAGVPIDMIGGTSIGAAIAALYAMGLNYENMRRVNRKIWIDSKPFNDYTLPVMSLIKGRKFENVAKMVYGETLIEDLWVNYFCVSTNLTTTEVVVHRGGSLAKALRATASLPGIAVPLVDGNNLLVDGGVLNNLPVDVMRDLCGGTVVAINVSPEKDLSVDYDQFPSPWKLLWDRVFGSQKSHNVPNILDLLMRTTMVGSIHQTNAVKIEADLYLQPPVDRFKLLDFKALDEIVAVGYEYAKKKLEGWKPPY